MAFSTYCSLNRSPPPSQISTTSSSSSTTTKLPRLPPTEEGSWKNQCFVGLSCAIIGLQLGNFAVQDAAAMDLQLESSRVVVNVRVQRWSDRRACQPWRANSFETIVPENLPRPSARRRWEDTGFPQAGLAAPPVVVAPGFRGKACFTL